MIGPSHRRQMNWENRCNVHDFGPLFEGGWLSEGERGASLVLHERDAAVACFPEIDGFSDAML